MFGKPQSRPDFETDGRDWPNRETSTFLRVGAIQWHVQVDGPADAPVMLLLHGTGAASHSFRDMLPALAKTFRVIVPDLPGHGFTDARSDAALSLPGMAKAVAALCEALDVQPQFGVGHSAGAAILLQMACDQPALFQRIIGINSALKPIEGNAIFSPLAKLLFVNPFVPKLFAWRAGSSDTVSSLLARTGSTLDANGVGFYKTLTSNAAHVAGAIGMMSKWDLHPLRARFSDMSVPTTLIVAEDDPMVPPSDSYDAERLLESAEIIRFKTGGHLMHEAMPEAATKAIIERCAD